MRKRIFKNKKTPLLFAILSTVALSIIIFLVLPGLLLTNPKSEETQTIVFENTISYGLRDSNGQIVDVGTQINQSGSSSFSGDLEIIQDMEGQYLYYLNILKDLHEIPYEVNGEEVTSANIFSLTNKQKINIDLSIDNISEGNELMILLFKYPKSNDSMTLERSLEYSVMGLRFNLTNNSTYPQSIKFLNDNDTNDYNARISMVNVQSSNEAILELEKRSNDSVELLLGQTSNENSRHSILPFINGSLIEKNELPPNTVYEISDNKLYRIPIKIPVTKKENSIFQLVDVLSPYQMDDGIYSITEIDFSNPVLIKNSK
ncbi:hypothetical protein AB1I55_17130 [Enterococcus entomosocium]|uniref:DUF4179 domain-containing protein n=3 Tax=Enterococcus TaxID=1350 RepID=A0ABV3MHA2_9ENTE|nr:MULTISPECIES: hypothetical protein [Enterococcus]OTO96519.1 hypothetical protein A5852_002486 [Enterococcus faecium]MBF0015592.1 hypothetical protein [Enterococcus casseliflavus]MBO1123837.1 hypothetical protein [Enterococcus casseliflavus]MDB1717754.1 hypothetical protein [Enterococcus casseliflavus]MEC5317116.1 hypothetical protein [Enterococcus casseliflavus]